MPRNASGTFSLVSGNPVVSGTLIDATWANNTLNDIANEMTDSLSRSGEGGMLAPLRLTDGVQATPGLGFTNEPGSGLYRAGTNEWWSVAGGAQVQQHTANGAVTRFAAGAVGTPSLAASGDLNTGLWFPAADTIAASVGGVESFRVNSSGNMGIGTSSPSNKLEVVGTAAFNGIGFNANAINTTSTSSRFIRLTSTGGDFYVGTESSTGGGVFPGSTAYAAALYNAAATPMQFWTGGTLRATLDASGNLGIGTSSPISGSGLTIGNDGNGSATVKLAYSTSATERASVQMNGANGEMRLTAGYAGYGGLMTFFANGSERARITSDGNIVAGASAALATTATNGFLYVPTCAGVPTGTPTAITGMAPIVVDTTNNRWYFYSGGAWRNAGP
jgi:hypothetical protein